MAGPETPGPRASASAARSDRPGPHAQLRAQPVGHLAPGDQRLGPVAYRGELPDQVGVGRLVQRVGARSAAVTSAPRLPASPSRSAAADRAASVSAELGPLPPPGRLWPSPRRTRAAARRGTARPRHRRRRRRRGAGRRPGPTVIASGRSPTAVREVISASSPTALRRAQTAVRRFARAAGRRRRATGWPPRCPRDPGVLGAGARTASSRLTGGRSESCSPSWSAATPPSSRTCSTRLIVNRPVPWLTLR